MSFETVTTSRSKRSTAGNRLRELLEQAHALEAEEGFEEVPDDTEFETKGDVEDVFEEDFESTDEEADEEAAQEAAERALEKEERAIRKAERQKGRHYHNPLLTAATSTSAPPKSAIKRVSTNLQDALEPERKKRRVSVVAPGESVSTSAAAEVGEEQEHATPRTVVRRSGMRASTLAMKEQIDERLREQKERNAMTYPRRPRHAQRRLTQADLIAIALQTEESNVESLRIWLEEEEERKRINKIARKVVAGPRISWISRRVDAGPVSVVEDAKGNERAAKSRKRKGKDVETEAGSDENAKIVHTGEGEGMNSLGAKDSQRDANAAPDSIEGGQRKHGDTEESGPRIALTTATTSPPGQSGNWQTATLESQGSPPGKSGSPAIQPAAAAPSTGTLPSATDPTAFATPAATSSAAQPLATGSMPSRTDMKPLESAQDRPYERNYVILSSIQGQANELRVLFGDHADWTALKRIPIRHRPMQRKPPMCLLTGRPAKYRHPVSLIPYATAEAYRLIDQTLRHDFLWSEDRMAFLGTTLETDEPLEKADGMDGIEEWDDAARGWWTFLTPEVQQDHQAHQEGDISMQEAAPTPSEEAAASISKQRSTKKSSKPTKGSRPRKADVR